MNWNILPGKDRNVLRSALAETDLVATSLRRIHGVDLGEGKPVVHAVEYVGEGGAMCVYRVWAGVGDQPPYSFALKMIKSRRLAAIFHRPVRNASALGEEERVEDLINWVLEITKRVNRAAPEIYPLFGGYWRFRNDGGTLVRLLTEQFIDGPTLLERRIELENMMAAGELDYAGYTARRVALDRLTVAAFVRLWNALDRSVFTSDPSPWNVKVVTEGTSIRVVILDLHLLAEPAPPIFLIERFQALYGLRAEIVRGAILPGIADVLGREEAATLFRELQPQLDELSAKSKERVGTDLYSSVRRAIVDWFNSMS